MKQFTTRKAAGFSLLELLLVVAVGAVLILAGLGAYRLVTENNNINQSARSLMTLKQQVQQTYAGQATYGAGNIIDDLVNMRALPSELVVTGNANNMTAKGTFGPVLVATAANTQNFVITYQNVPRNACVRLGQQFTPTTASDLVSVTVNGNAPSAYTQVGLTTACANDTNNVLVWTFR